MVAQQPASLTWARRTLAALVALGAVVTALTVVLRDQLIRSWADGRSDLRRVLRTQGLEAVKNGDVRAPAFVPVALVLFVVVAALIWVLAAFLQGGFPWARVALTATLFFLAVGTVAALRTGAPVTFVVLALLSFPLEVVAGWFLWHKDTSAYLAGTWSATAPQGSPTP
jgi:hypothetical protein